MDIKPIGFLQYSVLGQEGVYQVDLEANNFFGHCSCAHFVYKIQPALNSGQKALPCKHLRACRDDAWFEIAKLLSKHWKTDKNYGS